LISSLVLRRWGPPVLLALLAFLTWSASSAADVASESDIAIVYDAELETPVLSARRAPRALQAPVADEALSPALVTLVSGSTADTCLVIDVGDRRVANLNPNLPLVPASNQKVLTTFAALSALGTDTTFSTRVFAQGSIVDGVLNGDIVIVGGGDPFLVTQDFQAQYPDPDGRFHSRFEDLVEVVVTAGITEITGGIVGDESLFDSERYPQGWATRLIDQRQSGPLSALAVNEGFVSWPNEFTGSFRARQPSEDPALNTAQVFEALLDARGIVVQSAPRNERLASGATQLGELVSAPLSDLVVHINSFSNNFGAEIVTKHLGLTHLGIGSTAAGAQAVMAELAERGLDVSAAQVFDGSGLAEADRLTCSLMADILNTVGPNSVLGQSLSIGGQRGSLAIRHVGTNAEGQIYAKTGTLNGSTALSGFVLSPVDPEIVATFAYLVNGELAGVNEAIRGLQEPFVEELAQYPKGPSIAELGPAAARIN
jgi:D-alanyl-D-alanine carboxypeptidase/D-alanyl-D-alanine-endopeptidase (penicillin-binding protein 4)